MNPQKPKKKDPGPELAPTLAGRVRQLRDLRNMTLLDLAKASRFPMKRLEDIEGGIEVWLSITDRTILSRALCVNSAVLQESEAHPAKVSRKSNIGSANSDAKVELDDIGDRILAGEVQIACPHCGQILKTGIEDALDHEGNPIQFARAYCPVCPFAIR